VRTLHDYRSGLRLYLTPRIGHLPIRGVRPSTITKLYRDLLTSGAETASRWPSPPSPTCTRCSERHSVMP
jgi:hypothetical protein